MDNEWQDKFCDKCKQYQFEATLQSDRLVISCPEIPDINVQKEFASVLPAGIVYEFKSSLRKYTEIEIKMMLNNAGVAEEIITAKDHCVTIDITDSIQDLYLEGDTRLKNALHKKLTSDPYVKSYKILLEGELLWEYNGKVVAMLAKQTRPVRERIFNDNDLLDLKISLEASKDVNDFINSL
jgi:hypothetical protein